MFENSTAQEERFRLFHVAPRGRCDDFPDRLDCHDDDENVLESAHLQDRGQTHMFLLIAVLMQALMELWRRRQHQGQQQTRDHRAN